MPLAPDLSQGIRRNWCQEVARLDPHEAATGRGRWAQTCPPKQAPRVGSQTSGPAGQLPSCGAGVQCKQLGVDGALLDNKAVADDLLVAQTNVVAEAGRLADVARNLGKRVEPTPDGLAGHWLDGLHFLFQGVQGVGPRQLGP